MLFVLIHRDSKEGLTQRHYCGDPKKGTDEVNEKVVFLLACVFFFLRLTSILIGRKPYEFYYEYILLFH